MITFLHTFQPQAVLFSYGIFKIYWYGLFVVLGIIAAMAVSFVLARYYKISADTIFDLSFWLIIGGLAGGRIYDIFLQLPFYETHPLQTLEIWKGGLAIHGAIISGLLIIYIYSKKKKLSFWQLAAILVPGLALAQAIGRWGNYFNQELFGLPTALPWGIPIDLINRPLSYLSNIYFHPTFLYESLGCLLISIVLITFNVYLIKNNKLSNYFQIWSLAIYMILYSLLRFFLEFIRLDETPSFIGLRWPQFISLVMILLAISLLIYNSHAKNKKIG